MKAYTELDIEDQEQLVAYLQSRELITKPEGISTQRLAGGVSNRAMLVIHANGTQWVIKQALSKLRVQVVRRLSRCAKRLPQCTTYTTPPHNRLRADEGGLAPPLASSEEMLSAAVAAIEAAGLTAGREACLTVDVAATHFYAGKGQYLLVGKSSSAHAVVKQRMIGWLI